MAKADKKTESAIDPAVEMQKRRVSKLRSDRGTLNSHLEEIREVISPHAATFIGMSTAGEKRMTKVYDPTGIDANEKLAASMGSFATNSASRWFALRTANKRAGDVPAVKNWLSAVQDRIYEEMYAPDTQINSALDELYIQLGAFGTAVMFIGETSKGGLLFQTRALSECFIAENADGVVDTLYRIFSWTVRQCYDTWGDACSKKVCDAYDKGKYDDMVEICHGVYPRMGVDGKKRGKMNMPYASCYFEMETCNKLDEGGFPEFPYAAPRWRKAAGETYGRSPGMTALPDVKMLQAMMVETIKSIQKMTNPAVFIRDDGMVGAVRNIPGATNFYRGNPNEGIMQMPTTDKLPITLEEMDNLRDRIRNTFHNDVLQLVEDREMTLGEAMMRRRERMRLQSPTLGRLDSEMLGPMIQRVYGILLRNKKLPEAPEEMDGEMLTIEFVSPLANAQKQEQLGGIVQVFDYLTPLGELGLQALMKKLNADRLIDHLWDVLNNDPTLLNTPEEQQAIEEKAAAAQSAATAPDVAGAVNDASGAIKNVADASATGTFDPQQLMQMMARMGPAMAANGKAA